MKDFTDKSTREAAKCKDNILLGSFYVFVHANFNPPLKDIRITIDIRVHGQPTNKRLLKVDRVLSRNLVSGNRFFVTFGRIPGERILKVTKKSGNRGSHQRATA